MREHKGIVRGQRLELVLRGSKGQRGQFLDLLGETLGEFRMRIEPCADRGAALRQGVEPRKGCLDPADASFDLHRIAGEFLAQGHGRGVLKVGAADFDDVLERLGLLVQGMVQVPERREAGGARFHAPPQCAWPTERRRSRIGPY